MKNLAIIAASLALSVSSFAAQNAKTPAKKVSKEAPVTLKVDPAASKVTWVGKKVAGAHSGTVKVKEGTIEIQDKGVAKGEIVIDLASIQDEDLKDAEYKKKLEGHLKSADFFDVEKYPTAVYKIESVQDIKDAKAGEPNALTKGTLTMHGISKPYETKVTYAPITDGYEVKGKIEIDRTLYGLKYNSKKFFDPKALGDKLIDDKFEVNLDLVAKK